VVGDNLLSLRITNPVTRRQTLQPFKTLRASKPIRTTAKT